MASAWRRLVLILSSIANWRFFKPVVFVACALPLVSLAWKFALVLSGRDVNALGADPTKMLLDEVGETALTILLLTLTVTPFRRIFKINRVQIVRRMLGVWSFTYVAVHVSIYLVFDQLCYSLATCDVQAIWDDILKRRFIFAGQVGFFILLLLAITSTAGWVRRLKKNWARLHRLAYVAAVAGVVHLIWIQKSGFSRPLPWIVWLAGLLAIRVFFTIQKRLAVRRSAVTA